MITINGVVCRNLEEQVAYVTRKTKELNDKEELNTQGITTNATDIAALDTRRKSAETALKQNDSDISTNVADIAKLQSAVNVLQTNPSVSGTLAVAGATHLNGQVDVADLLTAGAGLTVDGTLHTNSFEDVEEETTDGATKTLQAALDAKQDKLTSDGLVVGVLDRAVGFNANGDLVKGQLGSGGGGTTVEAAAKFNVEDASLQGITIDKTSYRLVPQGTYSHPGSLAIGDASSAGERTTVIGPSAKGDADAVAIGLMATANSYYAAAIGKSSSANGGCIAIGYRANATGTGFNPNSIAIGYQALAPISNWFSIDSTTDNRTYTALDTDHIFFRNQNVSSSIYQQSGYTNGKTLTQYLDEAKEGTKYYHHTIFLSNPQTAAQFCFNAVTKSRTPISSIDDLCAALGNSSYAGYGAMEDGKSLIRINVGTAIESTTLREIGSTTDTALETIDLTAVEDTVSAI